MKSIVFHDCLLMAVIYDKAAQQKPKWHFHLENDSPMSHTGILEIAHWIYNIYWSIFPVSKIPQKNKRNYIRIIYRQVLMNGFFWPRGNLVQYDKFDLYNTSAS